MTWLITALLVGVLCILLTGSCSRTGEENGPVNNGTSNNRSLRGITREQIIARLEKLEKAEAPESTMGAMCYEMAAPPTRADYVCPKCGEKTLYTDEMAGEVQWELESARRQFETLAALDLDGLKVVLDESAFCSHCSPNASNPNLVLKVTYPDGYSKATPNITSHDLGVLHDFLQGETSYETSNEGTAPLKPELPRLRAMLGVEFK